MNVDKPFDEIEKQAKILASANKGAEAGIQKVFWFPHPTEIRLVEVDASTIATIEVEPFYFSADTSVGITSLSAIAIIQPNDVGRAKLPDGWGNWNDAKEL
jgi:hypothetical protein